MKTYSVARRSGQSIVSEVITNVYDIRESEEFLKFVDEKGVTLYAISKWEVLSYQLLTPEVDSE